MVALRASVNEDDFESSISELSPEDAADLLDRLTTSKLGMSGSEFVRQYQSGEIVDADRVDVIRAAMLLPLLAA